MILKIAVEENEIANIIRYLHVREARQFGKIDDTTIGRHKIPARLQKQLQDDDSKIDYDIESVLLHLAVTAIDKMENKEGGRE